MLLTSPFKTPEFKALFKEWNQILEDGGLEEIENFDLPNPSLKKFHSNKWTLENGRAQDARDIKAYYEMAGDLLESFPFKTETQKRMWEMHCDGMSVRQIAQSLNQRGFTKTRVQVAIVTIERKSGIKRG